MFIVFCPALFLFQIHDPQGGFRKEIIALAILAWNAYFYVSKPIAARTLLFYSSLIVYPLAILSHELVALLLPILLFINHDLILENRRSRTITAILTALSAVTFILCIRTVADDKTIDSICASLDGFCKSEANDLGALSALTFSVSDGLTSVKEIFGSISSVLRYFEKLLLALAAFIPVIHQLKDAINSKFKIAMLFTFYFGLIAVHSVAIDWGRLLYIQIAALFLVSFNQEKSRRQEPGKTGIIFTPTYSTLLFALLYGAAWRVHHVNGSIPSVLVKQLAALLQTG